MRYLLLIFLSCCLFQPMAAASYNQGGVNYDISPFSQKEQKIEVKTPETQAKIAFGMSLLGVLLIAVPYVSLLGLFLGIGGMVLGFLNRKKVKRKLFARLAMGLGAACLVYFFAALVLVLFV